MLFILDDWWLFPVLQVSCMTCRDHTTTPFWRVVSSWRFPGFFCCLCPLGNVCDPYLLERRQSVTGLPRSGRWRWRIRNVRRISSLPMLKPPCKTQSAHLIGMCIFFLSNFYLMYVYYFFLLIPLKFPLLIDTWMCIYTMYYW